MGTRPRSWEIVCRVVDNYGDAGVAWRLARQLANEHGARTTLWIDDPAPLARLVPGVDPGRGGTVDGVRVRRGPDPDAPWVPLFFVPARTGLGSKVQNFHTLESGWWNLWEVWKS